MINTQELYTQNRKNQMSFPEFSRYVAKYMDKDPLEIQETLKAVKECLLTLLPEQRNIKVFDGLIFVPRVVEKHEYKSPTGQEGEIDTYVTYCIYMTKWFKTQMRMRQGVTDRMLWIDGKWCKESELREIEKKNKEEELMLEWYGEKGWNTEVPDIE